MWREASEIGFVALKPARIVVTAKADPDIGASAAVALDSHVRWK
jgi:hypothetical protein